MRRTGAALTAAGALFAISSTVAVPAHASDAAETRTATRELAAQAKTDFTGIVRLNNCSGSIVAWPDSKSSDKAMMLTNGHCRKTYGAEEVETDVDSVRTVTLLNPDGTDMANISTTRLLYGTMFETDVALYQLGLTYADLSSTYDVSPLTVQAKQAKPDQRFTVISGYWRTSYQCRLNGFVYRLKEDVYTWNHSLRYRDGGCEVIHGTSGSPDVKKGTHTVIGIHNTTNDNGQECTINNPCEVDRSGHVTVHQGRHYGEQTWWFTTCLTKDGRKLDLDQPGCRLPRP